MPDDRAGDEGKTRRDVIGTGLAVGAIGAGAAAGVHHIAAYIVPEERVRERETFLAFTSQVPDGGTLEVVLPDKRRVQVKKLGEEYAGFSNVCPHLACRVSWEAAKEGETDERKKDGYFRCPCHEGLFGPDGKAFSGPPADAGQSLTRVDLVLREGALYVRWTERVS